MSECLGAALWDSQRSGRPPDEAAYLESLRRPAGKALRTEGRSGSRASAP